MQECDPASFGRNQENVFDESYRKAGKLDRDHFSCYFDPERSKLIKTIRSNLLEGHDEKREIEVELYKLNVYGRSLSCRAARAYVI